MVYPHNNDLGDKKPENPNAAFQEAMTAELLKIKTHYAAPMPQWVPYVSPNKSGKTTTIAMLDELIKDAFLSPADWKAQKQELYNKLYGKKPEPKLVDGMDFSAKYDPNPNPEPLPYTIKTAEIRFDIKGLFENTHGVKMMVHIPPEGLTETELREFLFKNFQKMTEKIISDVKKAKGIK